MKQTVFIIRCFVVQRTEMITRYKVGDFGDRVSGHWFVSGDSQLVAGLLSLSNNARCFGVGIIFIQACYRHIGGGVAFRWSISTGLQLTVKGFYSNVINLSHVKGQNSRAVLVVTAQVSSLIR